MTIILYDLAGAEDERRLSPFCWRAKLALAHKGLAFEAVPWRMVEKEAIAASGQGRAPVLVDGGRVVADSWAIVEYLEASYPDRPSLFGSNRRSYEFIRHWVDAELMPAVARMILGDFFQHLHEKDRPYFRETREALFGRPIEQIGDDRDARVVEFRTRLAPLRRQLAGGPFVGGDAPDLGDYLIFAVFQWSRSSSAFPLVADNDVVVAWLDRMLDAHDGLARRAPGYALPVAA